MSGTNINCPHCGATVFCPENMLGGEVGCPNCQGRFQAPPALAGVVRPYAASRTRSRRQSAPKDNTTKYAVAGGIAIFVAVTGAIIGAHEYNVWRTKQEIRKIFNIEERSVGSAEQELRDGAVQITNLRLAKHGCGKVEDYKVHRLNDEATRWGVDGWTRRKGEPVRVGVAWRIRYENGNKLWELMRLKIGEEVIDR